MRWTCASALSLLLSLAVVKTAAAGGVQVSMRDGRVTIIARDATVGDILAEWAKVGQTTFVNLEAVPRERLTLELVNVTEVQALAVLLRHVGGYVAARRDEAAADGSTFERILLLPESAAQAEARAAVSAPVAAAARRQPQGSQGTPPGVTYAPPTQSSTGESQAGEAGESHAGESAGESQPAPEAPAQAPDAAPAPPEPRTPPTEPPDRPMTSGQMAGRRPVATAGGPRDRIVPPQPGVALPDFVDEPVAPTADVPIPVQSPEAQASFKARQATETLDPRNFQFRIQQLPATPPAQGAPKPGVQVPGAKPGGPGRP